MAKKIGTVDHANAAGGYGIINIMNTDNTCYVSFNDVSTECLPIKEGDILEFNVIYGSRGKQAINVTKYNGGNQNVSA